VAVGTGEDSTSGGDAVGSWTDDGIATSSATSTSTP